MHGNRPRPGRGVPAAAAARVDRADRTRASRAARAAGVLAVALATAPLAAQNVTFSTISDNAYGAGDINSCAVGINNLVTVGTHQFAAYYDSSRRVVIARRAVGSSTWQSYLTGFSVSSTEITDDHNVIAIAVDSAGKMHLSYNMHNVALKYAISNGSVTGSTLSSIAFTTQTSTNAPTLFPDSGVTTNSVTYPQFYSIPGSSNLLFTYRNGGAGGGSGNGNQFFNVYNPSTKTWTNNLVINGEQTNVNAYLNTLAYTSTNDLLMSWTWRSTPSWQTNSNMMFAQSPDDGTTWFKQGGTTGYTLPIIQSGSPATSVAQVIKAIPEGSSYINQTSMTVDNNDRPMIGSCWAPGWNTSTNSGDPNRQYMLVYYTGSQWKTSQVTHRTSDTAIDTTAADVRDLGRPIVLVDKQDRVLMVTRSQDTGMGSFSNPATADNEIVVYYNTVAGLNAATPAAWRSVTLDSVNMGAWEPTYDPALWASSNKLNLFYEPAGLSGQSTGSVKVLEWDEQTYFASLNQWNLATGGDWDTAGNWTSAVPNAADAVAMFGSGPIAPAADSTITLSGTKTVGSITFDGDTYKYNLVSGAAGALSLDNVGSAAAITANAGSHTIGVPVTIGSSGVNVSTAGGATLTISGNITGSAGIGKSGSGTLVLSGTNTYGGTTLISAGTLRTSGGGLSANTNLSINGGLLETSGSFNRGLGTAPGQVQIPGGASGFSASTADLSVTIPNGGAPLVWGSSTFAPSTLVFNNTTSINDVALTNDIDLNGAARLIQVNAATATLSGAISGASGSLQLNGAGTLVLSSSNTYGGGTMINSIGQGPGTLRAAASNALGTGAVNTGPAGNGTTGRLELVGNITLPNAITFAGRNSASVAIENVSGNNTLSGTLTLGTGGGNYWIQSDAGTLNLSGAAGGGVAITSTATGTRTVTLRGSGNGVVSGAIANGSATVGVTKTGTGTWTLAGNNTYTGPTSVTGGKLILSANLTTSASLGIDAATAELASGGSRVVKVPTVSITNGGKLDLKNNKLIVTTAGSSGSWTGSSYTGVLGQVAQGRDSGAWDGSGIVTSVAGGGDYTSLGVASGAEAKGLSGAATDTFTGQTVTATDTLIMYTYGGDANLDGQINIDDYTQIDSSVAAGGALKGWSNGDFNYDGSVDIDDYTIIDSNIGIQGTAFSTAAPAAGASSSIAVAAVPEPAAALLLVGASALVARRRRRRRV